MKKILIGLSILGLFLSSNHALSEEWKLIKGGYLDLCKEAQGMLNDMPYPKLITNGELPYSKNYPKFRPINLKPIEDYKPWLGLYREYLEVRWTKSRKKIPYTDEEFNKAVKKIDDYYKDGHIVFNRGDLDISRDGKRNNIIWVGLTEYEDISLKEGRNVFENGLKILTPIVFDSKGRFLTEYKDNVFGYGYPFYYDGVVRFARLGGLITNVETPHTALGTKKSKLSISDIYTGTDFFTNKPYSGTKQVCKINIVYAPNQEINYVNN